MKNILYLKSKTLKEQGGQALITLLFFMVIGVTVISSAALVMSASTLSASTSELGIMAYYTAESGAENGFLYLLRNPSYSGTLPTLSVGEGQAVVSINSGTVFSTGTFGTAERKIQIKTSYVNGTINMLFWGEVN